MGWAVAAIPRHNPYRPDNRYIFTFLRGNLKKPWRPWHVFTVKHAAERETGGANFPGFASNRLPSELNHDFPAEGISSFTLGSDPRITRSDCAGHRGLFWPSMMMSAVFVF